MKTHFSIYIVNLVFDLSLAFKLNSMTHLDLLHMTFYFVFNGLLDVRHEKMCDLDFKLSRSTQGQVKNNVVCLPHI